MYFGGDGCHLGDGRSGGSNVLRIQYAATGQPSAPLYRTSTIIAGIARDTGNAVERDPLAAAGGTVEISRRDGRVIDADSPPRHASGNRLLL